MQENGSPPLLSIKGLKVSIKGNRILDLPDEEINVFPGDVVGVIGENGAGKSTLANCVAGRMPFEGKIERNFGPKDLGIQFQYNSYDSRLKVGELVEIICDSKKSNPALKEKMKDFELEPLLGKKISKLSGGERQRMTLFLVLQKNPKLLILDELTTGLDYQKRQEILYALKNNSVRKTVLTVTHYFEEITGWANKLLILRKGHLVFWGEVKSLYDKYQCHSMVKFPKDSMEKVDVSGLRVVEIDQMTAGAVTEDQNQADGLLAAFAAKNVPAQNELKDIYVLYILALDDCKADA